MTRRHTPHIPNVVRFADMHVLWGDGELPSMPDSGLLGKHRNTRVSTVFVTEDDLEDPGYVEEKVAAFMGDYGMQANKVVVYVMIARKPTDKWGHGFPFKMRISLFPRK